MNCATASISAKRSNDRCPALPHSPAAFSMRPASVHWRASSSGRVSVISANWLSRVCGDTGVQRAPRLAQQRAIGGVLHECMLEQISRVRRHALPEQQTGRQ